MKAYITKIDPPKKSTKGHEFIRVYFQMEDGTWAATDLVPTFRNYKRWQPITKAGPGSIIDNVVLLLPGKVNADSHVALVGFSDVSPFVGSAKAARDVTKEKEMQPCLL